MVGGRQLTIFCIDVSASMANTRSVADLDPSNQGRSITNLEFGLQVVKNEVSMMLLAGLKTVHCGVVLFGVDRTQNSLSDRGYRFIWEYLAPNQPTPSTLSYLDGVKLHLSQSAEPEKGDLLSAIIFCNYLMGQTLGKKKWSRKLVLVTDGESQTDWSGLKDERNRMRNDDVELTVVGLDFDDPEIGYIEPNKSENKVLNEQKLHKICRSIGNRSICLTALVAVTQAQSPQPRFIGSNPTSVTLSLGLPDADHTLKEDYDPAQTLWIACQLRKCTNIARPMSSKKISRLGAHAEKARSRADSAPKQLASELDQYLPALKENEEEDYPTGVLQTDRKYVYVNSLTKGKGANRVEDESNPSSDGGLDDGEEFSGEIREADPSKLVKAYAYGASRVIIDKEDEERIRQTFAPSLQIRGFLPTDEVPQHHLLNNVYYLHPDPADSRSQITLSAFVIAMKNCNRVALARYVGKSNSAEPKMVILLPVAEPSTWYFLFIQVPFAEDLREYFFPPLIPVQDSSARWAVPHRHIPTQEMQQAVDDFVDKMDLGAEVGIDPLTGRTQPWLVLEDTCSPSVHHLKNCVLYRLSNPDSEDLPPIHPALSKCFEPPAHVVRQAGASLDRIKRLLDIKLLPPRAPKRKKAFAQEETEARERIDLDAILGTPTEVSQQKVEQTVELPSGQGDEGCIKKEEGQDQCCDNPAAMIKNMHESLQRDGDAEEESQLMDDLSETDDEG